MTIKKIKTISGSTWEIYTYSVGKVKQYGTRLIARNGKLICGNTGFNTVAGAVKNIKAIGKHSEI